MAQISFDVASEIEANKPQYNNQVSFNFFTLRNDGDEAIVRFIYDNTSQFKIYTVHDVEIEVNGQKRSRKVSCLRNPHDSTHMCPLCNSGKSSRNTFMIEMLQYTTDPKTNTIVATPVIWERSMLYATRIKSLIDEYGPLSDCIFKIKRCGAAGSRETTYEIYYGNPKMYPDDIYLKDFSGFDNIRLLGTVVLDKNYDDLDYFVNTGRFPVSNQGNNQENNQNVSQPQYSPKNSYNEVPQGASINNETYVPVGSQQPPQREEYVPVNNAPQVPNRTPVRQYDAPSTNVPPQRATRYY